MVVPPDRLGVYKTVFFTMESVSFVFLFSTPLVSFRVARIWLFVVVTVSRETCQHLQNRIFIFYCILQGRSFWPFARSRLFFDFLFLFFHPSQLLFVFFFSSRRFAFFYFAFSTPLVSFSFLFFRFSTPLVSFSFFLFFTLQKGSPLGPAEKLIFYIFKRMLFMIVFFGRSGARFYAIFPGLRCIRTTATHTREHT